MGWFGPWVPVFAGMTEWGVGVTGVVGQEAGWGWMSSGVAQVTWDPASAGTTGGGAGVVGMRGPSTSLRMNGGGGGLVGGGGDRGFAQGERGW